MEILISLWLVLFWKPLCQWATATKAWAYGRRTLIFCIVGGLSVAIGINLWGLLWFGPREYFSNLSYIMSNMEEHLRTEREAEYRQRKIEKRRKAEERANGK